LLSEAAFSQIELIHFFSFIWRNGIRLLCNRSDTLERRPIISLNKVRASEARLQRMGP